jgi:hypothetical protein
MLAGAHLVGTDLCHAKLRGANLSGADLSNSDISGADLSDADLSGADLRRTFAGGASFREANLSGALLTDMDLTAANLSGAKGLLNAADWLSANFARTPDGLVVYRASEGNGWPKPEHWRWEPGAVLTETCDASRTALCGCGVHFATAAWLVTTEESNKGDWWECLIRWLDLSDVCVPYNTTGKARCARLHLTRKVIKQDLRELVAAVAAGIVSIKGATPKLFRTQP